MNCDEVFELVTGGDSEYGSRREMEQHLRICDACRTLARTLGPAADLFEEVAAIESARVSVSELVPNASLDGGPVEDSPKSDVSNSSPLHLVHRWARGDVVQVAGGLCGYAAVPILLVTLFSIVVQSQSVATWRASEALSSHDGARRTASTVDGNDVIEQLLELELPRDCTQLNVSITRVNPTLIVASSRTPFPEFRCCTYCHTAARSRGASQRSLGKLKKACAACHAETAALGCTLPGPLSSKLGQA